MQGAKGVACNTWEHGITLRICRPITIVEPMEYEFLGVGLLNRGNRASIVLSRRIVSTKAKEGGQAYREQSSSSNISAVRQ